MKRYGYSDDFNYDKRKAQEWRREHNAGGFKCSHCKQFVVINNSMGTANRNHCNWCLWSKHIDESKGDRRATCNGGMKPIGLTFKHEGYGRVGELMLVHLCSGCQKISINRIARDDSENTILGVFNDSLVLEDGTKKHLENKDIDLLEQSELAELHKQLFGQ